MMNRRGLMISTMLMSVMGVGGVVGFAGNVWAADVQCLKTPSCEELGYTEVACFQNNGVKCPYGDKYFCVCPMNYKFTCTGENQTGGSGEACNGKYAACSCTSGLMWNDGACGENCPLGSILFNDFTCSDDFVSGKTPIGVVVYKDGKGAGQALALNPVNNGTTYVWSTEYVDISSLPNLSLSSASQDFASCENSAIIRAQGTSSTYPAVWAAYNYSTEGTNAGDWCLPAAGIFTSYYNNQDAVNAGFDKVGGTKFTTSTYAWSSSEDDYDDAWYSTFSLSYGLNTSNGKDLSYEVRPVVGFCDDAENYYFDQTTDSCVKDNACQLGAIFYSDKTCSMRLKDGKTPIGVVVYVDENGANAQVMALDKVGNTTYVWGTYNTIGYTENISGLPDYTSYEAASQDFASCENSAKIRAHGDGSIHPAVWHAYNYSTEGTKVGDWCLPAAGIFTSIYNNQSTINTGFSRAGGTQFTSSTYAWSSSEYTNYYAWGSDFSDEYGLAGNDKSTSREVRPVLEGSIASEGAEFCTNSYQYTCSGANETGGSGSSCGGKYTACSCSSPYGWDSSSGSCVCAAQLTCTGEHETGGSGISCNDKYASCSCESGYEWVGCEISGEWKGCMPEIVGGEYICGY